MSLKSLSWSAISEWVQQRQLVVLGLLLGLAMVWAAIIGGGALVTFQRLSQSQLSVTGLAEEQVQSDKATWRVVVQSQGASRAGAYTALQADVAKVKAFLKAGKLPEADVHEDMLEVNAVYQRLPNGNTTNVVEGYELRKPLLVQTDAVMTLVGLAQTVDSLNAQGLNVQPQTPQYLYSGLDALKVRLIEQATRNAKARAEAMARSVGNAVGPIVNASSGVFQITAPLSTDVSDYGTYDTSTVDKKVTSVVNITFAVE